MKILITGYKGFIGSNMTSFFGNQPNCQIGVWTWDSNKNNWPNVKGYDWVIHLGATSSNDVEKVMQQNFDFSCWLFKECQKHSVHLQYASTSGVYGNTKDFSEYASCNPKSPYEWSKYLFDRWVFQQNHTSYVQGFRYFNVYGKWMHLCKNVSSIYKWRQQARSNKQVLVFENAQNIYRDWVWVGDICQLHFDFINTVKGSGLWNAGTGLSHSFLDIAETIAEQENAVIKFIPVPIELQPIKLKTCADLTHLKQTVGSRKWLNVYEWLDLES